MADENSPYDLTIFGATGFVGKLLCQYLNEQVGTQGSFRWAIAGRSPDKLNRLATQLGVDPASVPQIIADISDESTLRALCAQTRVVVSTVGPYALYGEPLIKICAETGTDYCDLTGEAQWIRKMIQAYEPLAQQSGARIVHCCGFDSVPSDLGVFYLQAQAQNRYGQPCVQVKMRLKGARGGVSGGTAASGLNLVKEATEDAALRQELTNPYSLCPTPPLSPEDHPPVFIPVQYDADFQAWVTPFVMAAVNTRIVLRSNALLAYRYGANFQYDEAILAGDGPLGWLAAQGLKVGLDGFILAAVLPPTRWFLENVLPTTGEGPSQEEQESGFYDLRFWGKTAAGQTIRTKVMGDRDPGYGSTAKILGQAGLCLAQDFPKSAKPGGFWTPATMFGEALIQRLSSDAGLTFEVL